jgi:23S rRNA (cytosine1962-C5)-methyltransferase
MQRSKQPMAVPRNADRGASRSIILHAGRERSLLRRHPWVFSGAIDRVEGHPKPGDTVAVVSAAGDFLAWAAYSPRSQIRARVWSWAPDERIDAAFFQSRIEHAAARRAAFPIDSTALRLVHGEADGLPGVIADRYGDVVVAQLSTAGADYWRDAIADALVATTRCRALLERSDVDVRALEGLPMQAGLLRGGAPNDAIEIQEHGLRYWVDVVRGHKTGFYLDQRENRRRVGAIAAGGRTLNAFCYTGGFTLNALAAGAESVLSIDSSGSALALARENAALNGLGDARADWLEADVFEALRRLRDRAATFDVIVFDPPKFAPTAAHAERAARAYKDINLLGFKLLRPGGLLVTFSCSGGVSADLFQKIVAGAAADAGADVEIVSRLQADTDHPVALAFPEGEYLKGLILRKL